MFVFMIKRSAGWSPAARCCCLMQGSTPAQAGSNETAAQPVQQKEIAVRPRDTQPKDEGTAAAHPGPPPKVSCPGLYCLLRDTIIITYCLRFVSKVISPVIVIPDMSHMSTEQQMHQPHTKMFPAICACTSMLPAEARHLMLSPHVSTGQPKQCHYTDIELAAGWAASN